MHAILILRKTIFLRRGRHINRLAGFLFLSFFVNATEAIVPYDYFFRVNLITFLSIFQKYFSQISAL